MNAPGSVAALADNLAAFGVAIGFPRGLAFSHGCGDFVGILARQREAIESVDTSIENVVKLDPRRIVDRDHAFALLGVREFVEADIDRVVLLSCRFGDGGRKRDQAGTENADRRRNSNGTQLEQMDGVRREQTDRREDQSEDPKSGGDIGEHNHPGDHRR